MSNSTVLFVDDDQKMLRCLRRAFQDEPYETLFASSGPEAIEILRRNAVQVVVSDLRMPDMSGLQLFEVVQEEHPDIIRIILSGVPHIPQAEISAMITSVNQGDIFKIAGKVSDLESELKPLIRQAVESYERACACDMTTAESQT